jgi:tetratricopeptide (TPR) repeat protein
MLRAERRRLHARAAWALEAMSAGRLEEVAALLGSHFVAAGEAERAVAYFEMAGDHATAAFANDEAVSTFRSALAIVDGDRSGSEVMARAAVDLRAKLANVLWRTARRDEAREALREAIRLVGPDEAIQGAHLQTRLGRLEMQDHRYDAAVAAFDVAEKLLGGRPGDQGEAWADQWLELMVEGRAPLHLDRKEPELALAALLVARPVVESRGRPARKSSFYRFLAFQRASQDRYRIDEEVIVSLRRGVAAAAEGGDESDIAWATNQLGYFLVLHDEPMEAREHLERSLAMAERIGDVMLRASNLVCLTLAAVRRQDVEGVRSLAPRALTACEGAAYPDYAGLAKASLAWLAWQDGHSQEVVALANESLELIGAVVGPKEAYFGWVGLWPVIAVHLGAGLVAEAVRAGRQMLDPSQQRLPDELESILGSACAAWERDEPEVARHKLAEALQMAHDLHYF